MAVSAGCTIDTDAGTITGNVIIEHDAITQLHLNGLSAIEDGELGIEKSPLLAAIDFGALASVSRVKLQELPAMSSLDWPTLTQVSDEMEIEEMLLLSSIDLSSLSSVGDPDAGSGGDLKLQEIPELVTFALPALTYVGDDFELEDMASVTSVFLPSLAAVRDKLVMENCPLLASFVAPLLTTVEPVEDEEFFMLGFMGTPLSGAAAEAMCGASCETLETAGCFIDDEWLFQYTHDQNGDMGWEERPTAETYSALCAEDGAVCNNPYSGEPFNYEDAVAACAAATTEDECRALDSTSLCRDSHSMVMCTAPRWSQTQGCPIELAADATVVLFAERFGSEALPLPPAPESSGHGHADHCYHDIVGTCSDPMESIDCTEAGQRQFIASQFGEGSEHTAVWRGRVAICCALPVSIDCGSNVVRQMLAVCETIGVRQCTC